MRGLSGLVASLLVINVMGVVAAPIHISHFYKKTTFSFLSESFLVPAQPGNILVCFVNIRLDTRIPVVTANSQLVPNLSVERLLFFMFFFFC